MITINISASSNLSPEEEKAIELIREFTSHLQSTSDGINIDFLSDLNQSKETSIFHRKGEYITNVLIESDSDHIKVFARKHFNAPKFLVSAIDLDEDNGELIILGPFKPRDLKGLLRKNVAGYSAKNSS